jgi:hypothetical protein
MVHACDTPMRTRRGWAVALVLVSTLLLAAAIISARPAAAMAQAFDRGDVLASVDGGINVYAPDGTLQTTLAGVSGAGALCFDPNGRYLVAPGAGLFDNSGNALPSTWASTGSSGECAVDGSGHVYLGRGPTGSDPVTGFFATVSQYTLTGTLLRTFKLAANGASDGRTIANLDLAPDQCTLYYDTDGGDGTYRFNVCANTQECPLILQAPGCNPYAGINGLSGSDQLRVLPNGDVATVLDHRASVDAFAPTGDFVMTSPPSLRWISLDPDGSSYWVGTFGNACLSSSAPARVWRLDLMTGHVLTTWDVGCHNLTGIAAYAPPLLGNADVAGRVDSNTGGTAEAFLTRARYSGESTRLHLYVDSSSTASTLDVGVYTNRGGRPGQLQAQGTIASVRPGAWNYVDVPSINVTAGQSYWVAVLGPRGGGTASFRDRRFRGLAIVSGPHNLSQLPAQWPGGRVTLSGRLSAFAS